MSSTRAMLYRGHGKSHNRRSYGKNKWITKRDPVWSWLGDQLQTALQCTPSWYNHVEIWIPCGVRHETFLQGWRPLCVVNMITRGDVWRAVDSFLKQAAVSSAPKLFFFLTTFLNPTHPSSPAQFPSFYEDFLGPCSPCGTNVQLSALNTGSSWSFIEVSLHC